MNIPQAKKYNPFNGLDFPPYKYQEYPKWVTPEGGSPVIVNTAEEEAQVMGGQDAEKPAATFTAPTPEPAPPSKLTVDFGNTEEAPVVDKVAERKAKQKARAAARKARQQEG